MGKNVQLVFKKIIGITSLGKIVGGQGYNYFMENNLFIYTNMTEFP